MLKNAIQETIQNTQNMITIIVGIIVIVIDSWVAQPN